MKSGVYVLYRKIQDGRGREMVGVRMIRGVWYPLGGWWVGFNV